MIELVHKDNNLAGFMIAPHPGSEEEDLLKGLLAEVVAPCIRITKNGSHIVLSAKDYSLQFSTENNKEEFYQIF